MVSLLLYFLLGTNVQAAPAMSFQGELSGGGRTSLKENLHPGRFLLVNFWASWCAPCVQEMGELTKLRTAHPDYKLDWISINVDTSETSSDVHPAYRSIKAQAPLILDPKHEIFSKYSPSKTLPYSVLIDSQGQIVETFAGYSETMIDRITARVK